MSMIKHILEQHQLRKQIDIAERLTSRDRIIGNMLCKEDLLRDKLWHARSLAVIGWLAFAYVAYCIWSAPVMIVAGLECRL